MVDYRMKMKNKIINIKLNSKQGGIYITLGENAEEAL